MLYDKIPGIQNGKKHTRGTTALPTRGFSQAKQNLSAVMGCALLFILLPAGMLVLSQLLFMVLRVCGFWKIPSAWIALAFDFSLVFGYAIIKQQDSIDTADMAVIMTFLFQGVYICILFWCNIYTFFSIAATSLKDLIFSYLF